MTKLAFVALVAFQFSAFAGTPAAPKPAPQAATRTQPPVACEAASTDSKGTLVAEAAGCEGEGAACLTKGAGHCCRGLRCVNSVCKK